MARLFAGILGPLAMLTTTASGLIHGRTSQSVAWAAWLALIAFAAIGYVLGWIANRTVEDSVQAAIAARLEGESEATAAR
ncbi:MAG: hypothetical protein GXX96_35010 [Planctomycetaceae bacterium]|nr:hypothetical protein [Planctomycetaceae bacterium]